MARTAMARCRTGARVSLAVAAMLAAHALAAAPASAQGWWPWAKDEAPRPREPVYRQPPAPIPGGPVAPGQVARPQGTPGSNICLQLEQRLVAEGQRGGAGAREALPRIENDIRQAERERQRAQATLDRGECYETFLFVKSLRNTPTCRAAAGQLEAQRQRLAELDGQRRQIMGTGERSFQDEIIRELARNGCGQQYVQEARRRDGNPFGGLFGNDDEGGPRTGNQFGSLPFATYRTVCVRLCDGFYFPVSFSTLPNHFGRDQDICQSRCAAPVELFYHQNPGTGVEQALSAKTQQPYSQLRTAFRYRKELVQGCSCKEGEYQSQPGERRADGAGPAQTPVPAAALPPARLPQRQP
jgi:hypothetical protein